MLRLRGCFPSMRQEEDRWSETIQSFHAGLLPYDLKLVVRVFDRIVRRGRAGQLKFFPDLPEVISIAEEEIKRPRADRRVLLPPEGPPTTSEERLLDVWEEGGPVTTPEEARNRARGIIKMIDGEWPHD